MKPIFLSALPLFVVIALACRPPEQPAVTHDSALTTTALTPIAVVELFTSQGCSSCPPADVQLAHLKETAAANGTKVYALSFHVDYWNYLGWQDPFSNAAYSQRQYQYRDWLNSRVYTPQMVVNGSQEFIGSRASEATAAVKKALSTPPSYQLSAMTKLSADQLTVSYTLNKVPSNQYVVAAMVERAINTQVKRGENHGKSLTHVNVVRSLNQVKTDQLSGELKLSLPADFTADQLAAYDLIVFVQDTTTGQITGAGQATWLTN